MTDAAPDRLLADAAWLRNLARRLVGSEAAGDLQQDVTLAALQRPEAAAAGRSWLAAVAHNLAVTLRRRRTADARRTQALPPREPTPSPHELVAEAELQQRAMAAVLALPPAYRDTLLLRFQRGLSVPQTAEVLGVPQETVRTRQKRALAILREQLGGGRDGRGRAAWLGVLASWGALVNGKHLVAATAAGLLLLFATVALLRQDPAPQHDRGGRNAIAATADAPRDEHRADDAGPGSRAAGARTAVDAEPPAAAAAPSTGALLVHVRWPDGSPAADTVVHCHVFGHVGRFSRTGADGIARFATLPPARYEVTTHQYRGQSVELAAGEERRVDLAMERGYDVAGLVIDQHGAAVADAEILLSHVGVWPHWTFVVTRSDPAGRFAVRGCRGGAALGARAGGAISDFELSNIDRHGGPAGARIVQRLTHLAGTLRGTVTDAVGTPIADAWVALEMVGEHTLRGDAEGRLWARPVLQPVATDAAGRFAIESAPAGEAGLTVYARGFAPAQQRLVLRAGEATAVAIALAPGAVLSGTVRDEAGEPIAGAEVESEYSMPPLDTSTATDAEGRFALRDLPPGDMEFVARAPGLGPTTRRVTFTATETATWDVVLARGTRILGRLVDDAGRPLAGWFVDGVGERRAKTGEDGRFVLTGCAATGTTLLVRETSGFVPGMLLATDVAAGETEQTFLLPAARRPNARVLGRCVGPDGEQLQCQLQIEQGRWPVRLDNRGSRGEPDGTFDLGPLPPGSFTLTPSHPRIQFAPVALDLQPDERRDLGILRGALPAALTVRLAADAAVLVRAEVLLVGADQRLRGRGEGAERTFPRVFPGTYRLVLSVGEVEQSSRAIELAPGADLVEVLAPR